MAIEIKMNLNDSVWVELTQYGWDCIETHYRNLFEKVNQVWDVEKHVSDSVAFYRNRTEKYLINGIEEPVTLTEFQLHELMNILGQYTWCGNNLVINNNAVYLSVGNFIKQQSLKI